MRLDRERIPDVDVLSLMHMICFAIISGSHAVSRIIQVDWRDGDSRSKDRTLCASLRGSLYLEGGVRGRKLSLRWRRLLI